MTAFLDEVIRFGSAGTFMYLGYLFLVGYLSSSLVYLDFDFPGTGGSGFVMK